LSGTLAVIAGEEAAGFVTQAPADRGGFPTMGTPASGSATHAGVSAEQLLARVGLHQLAQRFLAPSHHAGAPLEFALYRYPDAVLSAFLEATRDLQSLIGQEMATRSRRLLQRASVSPEWPAAPGPHQAATSDAAAATNRPNHAGDRGIIDIVPGKR
jgi:hypothetical protein